MCHRQLNKRTLVQVNCSIFLFHLPLLHRPRSTCSFFFPTFTLSLYFPFSLLRLPHLSFTLSLIILQGGFFLQLPHFFFLHPYYFVFSYVFLILIPHPRFHFLRTSSFLPPLYHPPSSSSCIYIFSFSSSILFHPFPTNSIYPLHCQHLSLYFIILPFTSIFLLPLPYP